MADNRNTDEPASRAAPPAVPLAVLHQAARHPGRPAVEHDGGSLTYAELVRHADAVRTRLVANGLRPGGRVALLLDRSPDLVAAALGVLLAGGAYVGLDVREPPARLATMLADAGAPPVLTDEAGAARLPPGHPVIPVAPGPGSGTPAVVAPLLGQPCYVTYTSGSTGTPKGVEVTHGGAANLVQWYGERFAVGAADRMPQIARPSFDGWSLEVWPCLAHGATLCIPPDRVFRSAEGLARWLGDERITVCFLTTALGTAVLAQPWHASRSRLRAFLVGGEQLRADPPAHLPFAVYNVYGPTETAMLATCHDFASGGASAGPPPIGVPLTGVTGHVLDERLRPVPIGGTGELYLGGRGVAQGYLDRPGLTAARFVADPFAGGPARLYRSGDVVRLLRGGALEFVGRADSQVKLRGFRIEPGEVESAARALPPVADAVAVVHEPAPGSGILVLHVIPADPAAPPEPDALRKELAAILPDYLTPAAVRVLAAFPTNAHGKTDRAALAALPPQAGPAAGAGTLTGLEGLIAELWCEVLPITAADRDDSFFDLGGDSLAAMRVAAKARKRGLRLGAEDLFEHEVLSELAAALEGTEAQA
ncbi:MULTISPECIES: non-ribosomal peptide synthetase [unclassified Amycolatopsis]|uniref:non-ribosomal peptide synthetase n=1 Tax=unclassified Amycolatopsis TaxID=2618356 RepID=UPI00106E3921|nr:MULTISPECIES: non-ribosomal peptide synthetase [unclassified Amycolatopsis]MCG3754320.1 non-ribosomal peptide synthetase [Amycolatopsis sp. Poz14]